MSESEVSQIRDEDVLRRMWQQTEDFSRKKEIRAHMYRLREERLRNLYSPEPMSDGKGCEFTSAQGHVKSFADQTFQSMKSKEVRDAGSPPKEFTYRGQDLKELSNAGWNVESENRTTDDGRTHVKSVNANIEGRYDVEGGRGQFAAVDRQRQAVTEYRDDDSSLRRDETSSDTAAHEHVVRQTDDGTRITSTTSSSNTSSKIQQVSSTKHETVPYVTDEDYDRRHSSHDSKRDDRVTKITNKNDYEQTLRRNDYDNAELVSRKVEYPDSNTKVIVETRCLPDGTRVTSTRREFRVPAQSTRSESYQSRNESKSYSSQHKSDTRDSTSKVTRHTIEDRTNDIVDSQRNVDDSDFKRQIREYTVQDNDDYSNTQKRHVTNTDRKVSDYSQTDDDYSQTHYETRTNKKVVDHSTTNKNDHTQTQRHAVDRRNDNRVDEVDRRQATITQDRDIQHKVVKEIHRVNDSQEKIHNITMDTKDTAIRVHDTTMREQTDIDETNNVPRDGKVSHDRTRDVSRDQNTPRDKETPRNIPKDAKSPYNRNRDISLDDVSRENKVTEKRVHKIARDEKVEEVVERKTSSDHYQTTYQNDFQNRKISTDFSPTHQAWASSLRSDTPTTRPSTRASSPGSRTFKSSTSSLRSSVSPDKIFRKPSSRGGSPNKVDRYSPTRTFTSDHYSSTHSTQSINETRTNKNTSPERKPPTGRSPDRKPHDFHRQRPGGSPEKRSQNFGDRPNTSPERKPSQKRETSPTTKGDIPRSPVGPRQSPERKPNTSPQRKPTDGYPNYSSPRPSPSPERKSEKHTSINKHTDTYSRSPVTRSSPSPDRKPGYEIPIETTGYPTSSPSKPQYPSDVRQKSSKSPDRMPDYKRPEITKEKPDENRHKDFISKRPSVSPDRKPGYMKPTTASQPDTRKQSNPIDELNRKSPTKQASPDRKPTDVSKITKIKEDHYRIVDEETKIHTQLDNVDTNVKSNIIQSSPETPSDDSPECGVSPDETDKSPSLKNSVVNTEVYGRVDEIDKMTDITAKQDKQTQDIFSVIHSPKNKESPTNKDVTSRETSPPKYGTYDKKKPRDLMTAEITAVTTEDTKDVKYNSTRQNKTPVSDVPLSPGKKCPRDSTSPLKSPAKDTKYKQTTDFLTSEKKTEELYKKKTTKDHPRQLITPSSSPTRKPKVAETEPSTGQSSPTTSVSGFVYFGSPRTEKPIVTDLDEVYPETENLNQTPTTRPDTLDVNRSPSPSKIPCRSPSPEKHVPTTKDSLPRKSSLKKPTTDLKLTSPIEKPPTNFCISPSDEKPNIPEHNVTKTYHSQEPETGEPETGELDSVKPKPPLQRRETYEDRCKKILGMVDDTNNSKSITKETTRYTKKTGSNQSSPSVSPCDSPAPKGTTPSADHQTKKKDTIHADFKIDVTDFISREQEHIIKTTGTGDKPKTLSRETSPAELQDITRKTSLTINKTTQATDLTTTKHSQPLDDIPSRSSMSPDRKPVDIKYPRDTSPRKQSPEKSLGSSLITASVTSQYKEVSKTDEVEQMTPIAKTTKKSKPTRVLESPTRQIPKSAHDLADKSTEQPRTTSPSRSYPKDGSPDRKSKQPEGSHPDNVTPSKPRQVSDHTPGFMKTTAATTFKIESTTSDDMEETYTSKTRVQKASVNKSPIRQTSPEILRSTSPTKRSQPSEISPKRPDSSPQGKNYTPSDQSRTPSPTKQTRLSDISPERKSSTQQPTTQPKRPSESSPSRSKHAKPTETTTKTVTSTSKLDRIDYDSVIQETVTSTTKNVSNTRDLKSPTRKAPKTIDVTQRTPEKQDVFLERKPINQHPSKTSSQEPTDKHPQTSRSASPSKTPGYMKTTTSVTSKFDTTEFSNQNTETIRHQRSLSPSTPTDKQPKISSSPERKPTMKSPVKDAHVPEDENLKHKLGRSSVSPDKPIYMKPTASVISKFESSSTTSQDTQETLTSEHRTTSEKRATESPTRKSPEGELKDKSQYISKPDDEPRKVKTPGYMKTTTSVTSKFETTDFSNQDTGTIRHQRSLSPSTPTDKQPKISSSPERKPTMKSPVKDAHVPEDENLKHKLGRSSVSPDKPSYMKPTASVISKFESSSTTSQNTQETLKSEHRTTSQKRATESPTRISPEGELKDKNQYISKPDDEPRRLRTPSPIKHTSKITEVNNEFIVSEREQEILNKVQKSLRKLSPERKEKSPTREKSPTKSTTSLQDLDIVTFETDKVTSEDLSQIVEEHIRYKSDVTQPRKPKPTTDNKASSKPSSRTVSPTKKTQTTSPNKLEKSPESSSKSRSISPKKPISHAEKPQSPLVPRLSGIKPREQIPTHFTRKATPTTFSTVKIEKVTEVKKTNGATKQGVFNKTSNSKIVTKSIPSPTAKSSEPESKRISTSKGVKESVSPKKDVITRTTSDIGMKPKKTSSPQRIKSKPEIQVSDMSTKGPKSQKPIIKEPHSKLPNKPKSATALNTSTDEDDIIIDLQQSKSSRENSPDRICPTPINFSDDVGTPRFPDEVSEPDDDFVKRTHHTIRETETLVDDIVEICEDEELFVKKTNKKGVITEGEDSLLSVNDKVNKFTNKIHSVTKPKDVAAFKDTERRVHSDFVDENLKSDECLLTVSEKVNKFAKGQRDTKDSRSPSRKITDEYDKDTVYQDDYTKLSVNDKAHLFVETAENIKVTKVKPAQKVERLDISNVDESLKSDDCLLSVSDKVNKFVKTAETFLTDTQVYEETDKKIKEEHEKIIKQIVDDDEDDDDTFDRHEIINPQETHKPRVHSEYKSKPDSKEHQPSQPKVKDNSSPNSKPTERASTVNITTLRSSEAVKKAKALFENIASTQNTSHSTKASTKLTDIGVIRKSSKTDSTTALHPSVEVSPCVLDVDSEADVPLSSKGHLLGTSKSQYSRIDEKPRSSPSRLITESPGRRRSKSPIGPTIEVTTTKTVLSRYPASTRAESPRNRPESPVQRTESPGQRTESPRQRTEFPKQRTESPRQRTESPRQRTESPRQRTESPRQRPESEKPDKLPGYLRPTKTSQIKEEPKIEEPEVSTRRGSGKFGVELRRTSVERSTVSSERRRSVEHHQPCIEDIFDIELLEQMLEKVTGYEQRRRIRAQIRVAKHQSEHTSANTYTKMTKTTTTTTKTSSPERQSAKSPERTPKSAPQKTISPDRHGRLTPQKIHPDRSQPKESTPVINGHAREPEKTPARQRPRSPEKPSSKSTLAPKTPNRQLSPDKKRPTSPSKGTPKPKSNRFNEYASAYMKKVGLNDSDQVKFTEAKTKKTTEAIQTVKHEKQETVQNFTTSKSFNERTSSKDVIESVQLNGKRSPSPEKRQSPNRKAQIPDRRNQSPERKTHSPARKPHSPERHTQSPDRIYQRSPSPDFKRPKVDTVKESIIKTVYEIDKKIPSKQAKEEKPSWVTNRNLKKITSEWRTYSSKKIENEKPKYRAVSPSKVISKPIDVITSSYGPGPLDADGRPLFGIKALRNGGTNFQVKGTVIRQEFHSRNGGEPEGTVSVTAYSSQPEELEQLLAAQGAEPPSRIHGLSAITTTKTFGGDTGNTYSNVHTKEERASLEQFTHSDRKIDSRVESLETSGSFDRMDDTSDTRRIESRRDDKSDRTMKREVRTEVKRGKVEDRRERVEKREDKKTVRQSSVKSLTEKYIKSAHDSGKSDRTSYPKAGLILRTTTMRDSVSSDDAHPGLARADSEHSLGSAEDAVVTSTQRSADGVRTTTTTRTTHHGPTVTHTRSSTVTHEPIVTKKTSTVIAHEPIITKKTTFITQEPVTHRMISQEPTNTRKVIHEPVKVSQSRGTTIVTTERSFLDSDSKVTGVQDILTRMKNADIVIQEGDTEEDSEARALLNKFLGATVLMAGMQGYVAEQPEGKVTVRQETVRSTGGGKVSSSRSIEEFDLDNCWDERFLKKLLEECTDYEQRRRLRARIRTLMAEQEACASAVTEALGAAGASEGEGGETREEEEVTVTSSVRRDSSDKTVSSSTTTTKSSKVIETTRSAPKPVSPFAKFRQLEKQNSTNSPNSPKTPQSPGSPSQPYFKFTDPALQCSALTIKERLLQWCRDKTRDYENVKLENFSTSWADGLAFCALVHHFLPDAFDYSKLTPDRRRHNFTLAFKVADEKAGIYPLLDVDDMVAMRKPDWKCVFTYVQAIYRRFKDQN